MNREDASILRAVDELHREMDPPPEDLSDRIMFALDLEQNLAAEVAELTEEPVLAGHRGASGSITFNCEAVTVMVSPRTALDKTIRVDGWIAPEGEYRVQVRLPEGDREAISNEHGRFAMEHLPAGEMVQFVLRASDQLQRGGVSAVVVTPAVRL
ncbi:hypothetical protein [Natronoglycomyces albus]|uniref:Carboxypeptidase regulatory-like domain-containing protein n=1 Tax=Natronoglycomyces albus TaxID=2811108 RepID=A0A895XWD1_9ACTN|nr:hypothetical protein [Natronoglycomyces albus]QSB05938.1 carboxypeptidase regulatory-like domain-containing protein [Natronoglycomyces albus]